MAKIINWKLKYLNLENKYNLLKKSIIRKEDIVMEIIEKLGIKGEVDNLKRNLSRMNNAELMLINEKLV